MPEKAHQPSHVGQGIQGYVLSYMRSRRVQVVVPRREDNGGLPQNIVLVSEDLPEDVDLIQLLGPLLVRLQ